MTWAEPKSPSDLGVSPSPQVGEPKSPSDLGGAQVEEPRPRPRPRRQSRPAAVPAGQSPVLQPVPERPPPTSSSTQQELLSSTPSIGADEMYGADEKSLNSFLRLHPMLSMDACSQKTLQLVSGLFEKASVRTMELPVVPKSHDDQYLRPPDARIGERPCACGDQCWCLGMATFRHGADSKFGFICTEFLLPTERATFLEGKGLPSRRKKCLVCTRYFQNYVYIQARTDVNFKLSTAPISMQCFGNVCVPSSGDELGSVQLEEIGRSMSELPLNASPVHTRDGYRPEAMLFVDENFVACRSGREGPLATLVWKPVVRFSSSHYRYEMDANGSPYIMQVGIGADDPTGTGIGYQNFVPPPSPAAAPAEASQRHFA